MAAWIRSAAVLGIALCLAAGNAAAEKKPVLPSSPQEVADRLLRMNMADGWPRHEVVDILDGIMKKRFSCLRSNATGNRDRWWTLYDDVSILALDMGGPRKFVEVEGRYVIGWSCRTHSCDEKGLSVFDKARNDFVFAINHYIRWDAKTVTWAENRDIGMISIFVPPNYPRTEWEGLKKVARKWGADQHDGVPPPIQVYTVDCRVPKSLPGR